MFLAYFALVGDDESPIISSIHCPVAGIQSSPALSELFCWFLLGSPFFSVELSMSIVTLCCAKRVQLLVGITLLAALSGFSQTAPPPTEADRAAERRAAELVSRMTLEEKVSQMQNRAVAIPRLTIPAYE